VEAGSRLEIEVVEPVKTVVSHVITTPSEWVNPAHFFARVAVGDHMAHYGLYRLHDFDLQPAARFPRPALSPVELSVDVGKTHSNAASREKISQTRSRLALVVTPY